MITEEERGEREKQLGEMEIGELKIVRNKCKPLPIGFSHESKHLMIDTIMAFEFPDDNDEDDE